MDEDDLMELVKVLVEAVEVFVDDDTLTATIGGTGL